MKTLSTHVRRAFRRIRQSPLYAATIILCLTLGIGANTAIFSLVNMLILQPLPVEEADRLVTMLLLREGIDPLGVGALDYQALTAGAPALASAGLAERQTFELQGGDRPDQIEGATINRRYLPTLGVEPIAGPNWTAVEARLTARRGDEGEDPDGGAELWHLFPYRQRQGVLRRLRPGRRGAHRAGGGSACPRRAGRSDLPGAGIWWACLQCIPPSPSGPTAPGGPATSPRGRGR